MLPNEINLGPIVYKVVYIRDLLDDERNKKLTGLISINDATIKIEKDVGIQLQAMTLIHEIIHHIIMASGHESDLRQESLEGFIDAISSGFLTTLRLNPNLLEFIGELDDQNS